MAFILLTTALVNSATCPAPKKKADFFDVNCKGLMLEVRTSGGKTYYCATEMHAARPGT